MAHTTPRVEENRLYMPAQHSGPVLVGSQQWYTWLAKEETASFFFKDTEGSFTARKEQRKRGGSYWIAYRSLGGKLAKTYIGRNEDVTLQRLREVTKQLTKVKVKQPSVLTTSTSGIASKFGPPQILTQQTQIVERMGLLRQLDEAQRVKLTIVTAPAGYGKTTLLGLWYGGLKANSRAWITLDERDNDPIRFWSAVWQALRGAQRDTLGVIPLQTTPYMSVETIQSVVLNDKAQRTLILDDYHTITNEQIQQGMEYVLHNLPANMRIVIASRSEPPLALGRLRLYGQLKELGTQELRFKEDEIAHFFQHSIGVSLAEQDREHLAQRTEGWVAGLHMIGLALRDQQEAGEIVARFRGNQRSLFAYFAEEVFAQQTEEIQQFLLYTAPLREFTPDLCAAIYERMGVNAPDSMQRLLGQIERTHIFLVCLNEQQQSYRYHALFAEFLQEKITQSQPELIREIQRQVAYWYEQQGCYEDAIDYALLAQDIEHAMKLILDIGEEILWRKGEVGRLQSWLQSLPQQVITKANPQLQLLYIWALVMSGHYDQQQVEGLLIQLAEHDSENRLQGDIAAVQAKIAAFNQNRALVKQHSEIALQMLPDEKKMLRADVAFGMAGSYKKTEEAYSVLSEALQISQRIGSQRTMLFSNRYLAVNCIERGRLHEAERILQQALQTVGATEKKAPPVAGIIYIGLAELHYERNNLAEALKYAMMGLKLGRQSGEIKVFLSGHYVLAMIFGSKGELERAWQEQGQAEHITTMSRVPWLREQGAATALYLALQQQDIEGGRQALRKIGIDLEEQPKAPEDQLQEIRCLLVAQMWLRLGRYAETVAMLEPIVSNALDEKRIQAARMAQVLLANAYSHLGERQEQRKATQLLQEVLGRASQEGFVRTLVNLGEPLRELLDTVPLTGSAKAYAQKLQSIMSHRQGEQTKQAELSEREFEILQLIAAGMSNQEIADALILAISTVKVHVRNLCQKLGVQKRIQAVSLARELGLL